MRWPRFLSRILSARDTRREPSRFRPAVEGLESRWTPANVSASVVNGVLTLTATAGAFDDVIDISRGSDAGKLVLTGTGTTINGQSSYSVSGIRSVDCFMKGGDDTVKYDGWIRGNLTFYGGGGTNELELDTLAWIGGSARYFDTSGTANDDNLTISGFDIMIGRNVVAQFGEGTSWSILSGATIGGRVSISGGSGADVIATENLSVVRSFSAILGNGENFVGIESENDNIFQSNVSTFLGGAVFISTGTGEDTIEIGQENAAYILGNVAIATGNELAGGDTVLIDNGEYHGNVSIDLGGGNDLALIETVDTLNAGTEIAGTLTILGRGGNDTVAFAQVGGARTVYLYSSPFLDGGGGNDLLVIVDLYVKSEHVGLLADLGSVPANFETILI